MNRRLFLRRASLASAGLLVGDAALEAFERLAHRKVFALGGLPRDEWPLGIIDVTTPSSQIWGLSRTTYPEWDSMRLVEVRRKVYEKYGMPFTNCQYKVFAKPA